MSEEKYNIFMEWWSSLPNEVRFCSVEVLEPDGTKRMWTSEELYKRWH